MKEMKEMKDSFVTDDVRIVDTRPLIPPAILIQDFPLGHDAARVVYHAREDFRRILQGEDDRLAVIVGPCSIHDTTAANDYAAKLAEARSKYGADLMLIMRVYFEKPRTTVGWKGLINDPFMDETYNVNSGLRMARGLLLRLAEMEVPAATEFWTLLLRNTSAISSRGGPSALVRRKVRCIASLQAVSPCPSVSKTARRAVFKLPWMASSLPPILTASSQSPNKDFPPSSPPWGTLSAISSSEARQQPQKLEGAVTRGT